MQYLYLPKPIFLKLIKNFVTSTYALHGLAGKLVELNFLCSSSSFECWWDVGRLATGPDTSLFQVFGYGFRAVVHSQLGRRLVELDLLLDRVDYLRSTVAPAVSNGQAEVAVP